MKVCIFNCIFIYVVLFVFIKKLRIIVKLNALLFSFLLCYLVRFISFVYLSNERANYKRLVWKEHESKTLKRKRAGAANKPVVVYFLIPR